MRSLFIDTPARNGTAEGEARRDAAHALLYARRAELVLRLQAVTLRVALERGEVCADDVRDAVPIPSTVNPKVCGAAFAVLARAGLLQRTGFRKSRRPTAHARPIAVWGLGDRSSVAARLADIEKLFAAAAGPAPAEA